MYYVCRPEYCMHALFIMRSNYHHMMLYMSFFEQQLIFAARGKTAHFPGLPTPVLITVCENRKGSDTYFTCKQ